MPRAIPVPLREALVTRIAAGESVAAVAADLDVPYWTARTIWRRYRDGGPAALEPDYARCGRPGPRSPRLIHRAACALRRRHPAWGTPLIRLILVERFPDEPIADERTLRRWFQEAGLTRPPPPPREPPPPRAATPHRIWQLDAKEQVRLADGTRACWLLAVDEASGAAREPEVSPLGAWSAVGPERTRAALRDLFADWGRPAGLRVDNGAPWGSRGNLPSELALWAVGLGVAVHHNRPRRCQENAKVERGHGVLGAWAEPAACADAAALRAALTAACRVQREAYPAVGGTSRATAFPLLMAGGRPYDPEREDALFDERRVWADLAGKRWTRSVDKVGRISVYNRSLAVGRRHAGHTVTLQFDAEAVAWVVRDDRGTELARHPAPELHRDRILALAVAHRRPGAQHPVLPPEGQPYAR